MQKFSEYLCIISKHFKLVSRNLIHARTQCSQLTKPAKLKTRKTNSDFKLQPSSVPSGVGVDFFSNQKTSNIKKVTNCKLIVCVFFSPETSRDTFQNGAEFWRERWSSWKKVIWRTTNCSSKTVEWWSNDYSLLTTISVGSGWVQR